MSKLISYSLDNYPIPTTIFFIGLILGGMPMLFKKTKGDYRNIPNSLILLISFVLVLELTFLGSGNNVVSLDNLDITGYILLILVGIIAAATMVIPGISGSFVLMLLGYYKPIIETVGDLTNINNIVQNILF